jgi:hypothetical protein
MADWYVEIGQKRLAELTAGRAQALADLEYAKSNGDHDSASTALQNISDIDAATRNLSALYDQYMRSQQPPPEPSKEELMAKPPERMTHQDMYRILKSDSGSRHGIDDGQYVLGIQEAARRRSRGE